MKKLVALVASIAFSFGIGLVVPQTSAQSPAPKEEKKAEMTEKRPEKKSAKKYNPEKVNKKEEKK
jgi:hypothetical protein